jgi:alkanesulfonate monooxygenase SsuD/methylene tetrahydromethanopterin reductase-like flavin-dependent oxidoreductase (luciferase family)
LPGAGAAVFEVPARHRAASRRSADLRHAPAGRRQDQWLGGVARYGAKPVASASQNVATLIGMNAEQAMQAGILFAGSPDTVYQQLMHFKDKVGPFGHLVMVGRSGYMTHGEAEKGIKLFAREVLPRLKEIAPVTVG